MHLPAILLHYGNQAVHTWMEFSTMHGMITIQADIRNLRPYLIQLKNAYSLFITGTETEILRR